MGILPRPGQSVAEDEAIDGDIKQGLHAASINVLHGAGGGQGVALWDTRAGGFEGEVGCASPVGSDRRSVQFFLFVSSAAHSQEILPHASKRSQAHPSTPPRPAGARPPTSFL